MITWVTFEMATVIEGDLDDRIEDIQGRIKQRIGVSMPKKHIVAKAVEEFEVNHSSEADE
jgi:hypothetical protein